MKVAVTARRVELALLPDMAPALKPLAPWLGLVGGVAMEGHVLFHPPDEPPVRVELSVQVTEE